MKKLIIVIILLFSMVSCENEKIIKANRGNVDKCEKGTKIKRQGIVFINNHPCYVDNSREGVGFDLDKRGVKRKRGFILKAAEVNFAFNKDNLIVVDKIYKGDYFSDSLIKDYKHKVISNRTYISPDGKDWDWLKMTLITDKPIKAFGKHIVIFQIRLECKWFKGNYGIIADADELNEKEIIP